MGVYVVLYVVLSMPAFSDGCWGGFYASLPIHMQNEMIVIGECRNMDKENGGWTK